jgi:DnaJ-class molecular chaperone
VTEKAKLYIDPDIEECPFCGGYGEEEVMLYGQRLVVVCEECRGTGQRVELIGEDLPHPLEDK